MLETPWITLRRLFRKNNTDTKDTVKYVFELSDKFSLWIIGISLAAISLLISNLSDVKFIISTRNLNVVFFSLFLSVFCGIFYRIIFIFYYIYQDIAFRKVDFELSDDEHMDTESLLTGNDSFKDLIKLNCQFRNMQGYEDQFNKSDDIGKEILYNELVASYVRDVALAKRNKDATISNIADVYNEHLGISRKSFFKKRSSRPLVFTKYASVLLYFGFMLSFLFSFAYFLLTINIRK